MAYLSEKDGVEIIIVDDGSEIQLNIDSYKQGNSFIKSIYNNKNMGRSATLNVGAKISNAEYLLFLDADCVPSRNFFENALQHIKNNDNLVFGHIQFRAEPFFEYCENKVQQNRINSMDRWYLFFTTANFLIKKRIFFEVGGFSEKYRHYGMEDRDLLIRLNKKIPDLAALYSYGMFVYHEDQFSINSYLEKFTMSGKYTIPIFRSDHPEEYKKMKYSIFDYHINPWINWLPLSLVKLVAKLFNWVFLTSFNICSNYSIKEFSLKALKGIAVLEGTSDR